MAELQQKYRKTSERAAAWLNLRRIRAILVAGSCAKKQKAAQARNNTVEVTRKTGAGTCQTSKMRRKIKKYDTKMQQSEN